MILKSFENSIIHFIDKNFIKTTNDASVRSSNPVSRDSSTRDGDSEHGYTVPRLGRETVIKNTAPMVTWTLLHK